jgi:hypothetical protein
MKKLPIFLLAGLLLATPASQLSARRTPVLLMAEESIPDATVAYLLQLAAPHFGVSASTLEAAYTSGRASVTHLGSQGTAHHYRVGYLSQTAEYVIISDLIPN